MNNLLNEDNYILLENEELNDTAFRTTYGVRYWEVRKYTEQLETAINKLCEVLQKSSTCIIGYPSYTIQTICPFHHNGTCDKRCTKASAWKEWALKDE